jgi:hypothetical protein
MSALDRLLEQLKRRGLSIRPAERPGSLYLDGPPEEKTPEIWRAVKAFKPQLLELYGRKDVADPGAGWETIPL